MTMMATCYNIKRLARLLKVGRVRIFV